MPGGRKQNEAPSECPVCGANVPRKALACPACGADERTGWNEATTRYDGLDLPDDSFDDDEALKKEGIGRRVAPGGVALFWWTIGIGMIGVLIYFVFRAAF
jgi:hypothetical protein